MLIYRFQSEDGRGPWKGMGGSYAYNESRQHLRGQHQGVYEMIRRIDLTPSWKGILPSILAVLENAQTEDAKDNMRKELARMADAADRWNEHVRRAKTEHRP